MKEFREKLEEEDRQKKKEQKAKEAVKKELTALLGQVEMAKADAVKEFRASQTFIDACAEYYGDEFEDYIKQVKSIYPYLDLSKVSMDDHLLSTPIGNTILKRVMTSSSLRWIQRMIVSFLPSPQVKNKSIPIRCVKCQSIWHTKHQKPLISGILNAQIFGMDE